MTDAWFVCYDYGKGGVPVCHMAPNEGAADDEINMAAKTTPGIRVYKELRKGGADEQEIYSNLTDPVLFNPGTFGND